MQLNYKLSGTGPAVILIHGLFGDLDNLANLARSIVKDFTVIQIDLRNHGRSPRSDVMDYGVMAEDVVCLMDLLDLAEATLVGHSMGGKVAMQTALNFPHRVSRLVIADIAPVEYQGHHQNVFAGLKTLWEQRTQIRSRQQAGDILKQHIEMPEVTQFLLKGLPVTQGELMWRTNYPAIRDNYPHILGKPKGNTPFRDPTLFIKGGNSDYILAKHQPEIMTLFPTAKAKVIADTGHWLHAEKPRLFNKLVNEFIRVSD